MAQTLTPRARAERIVTDRLWPRGPAEYPLLVADIEQAIVAAVDAERARLAEEVEAVLGRMRAAGHGVP